MGCTQTSLRIHQAAMEVPENTLSVYEGNDYKTTDGTACLPIRLAPEGVASKQPYTIIDVFDQILKNNKGGMPALRQEFPVPEFSGDAANDFSADVRSWKTWSYEDYYNDAKRTARGFISLGLDRHAAVNIWGFNSPEWMLAEVGAIFAGGKAAGIYPTDTPAQIIYKIQHSNGQIVVLEDEKKFIKVTEVSDQLPNVKAIVCWGFEPSADQRDGVHCEVITWNELMARGQGTGKETKTDDAAPAAAASSAASAAATLPGIAGVSADSATLDELLQARMADQKPGHCCALIYTSGTTGQPKAVMISHDNIVFESSVVLDLLPTHKVSGQQERLLSYLPLSHVAGMLLDVISPLFATAHTPGYTTVHFARPYDLSKGTVGHRLRAVKPTVFLGVPRVWEKIQAKITKIGQATKGLKRKIAMWAKDKGQVHAANCQMGGSGAFPSMYGLASKLVHSKVKGALGLEECKFAFTGAAPIAVETLKFFGRLGLQINEVYGMSECTGATTWSLDTAHIWGSCGFAMPGMEVKVFKVNEDGSCGAECPPAPSVNNRDDEYQGEICFRGRHIMMGYMANPALGEEHVQEITRKLNSAIDDEGWLHSGDKGIKTDTGMVKITGRYKELLIGAGGENVAPVPIEDAVKAACPAISNIMMFGDRQPYLAAMVTLKAKGDPGLTPGADELDCVIPGSDVTTISAAMSDPTTIKYITDCIIEGNKVAPNRNSTIKKFTILPHDFSVEGGELTSTLKLKRSVAMQHFEEVAERTYQQPGRDTYVPFNAPGSTGEMTKSKALAEAEAAPSAVPAVAKSDEPAAAAPEPVAAPEPAPEPVAEADEPAAAPEPVAASDEPVAAPEPVAASDEPVAAAPEPVAESEPVATTAATL